MSYQLMHLMAMLRDDERGAELAEYGLVLALVAVAAIAALGVLGGNIDTILTTVSNALGAAAGG